MRIVGLLLTPEQVRSAPAEVKHWLRAVLDAELSSGAPQVLVDAPSMSLAACTLDQAAAVLDRIRSDFIGTQVFFELGRESADPGRATGPFRRIALSEIARHCRIRNTEHLGVCLDAIADAFRDVVRGSDVALFALDGQGWLYVHDGIHASIAKL